MVADAKDSNISRLELCNLPGGAFKYYSPLSLTLTIFSRFEQAMMFEITASNVSHLHCAAEILGVTNDYYEVNRIDRTETYLNEVVVRSPEKSVEVLPVWRTGLRSDGIVASLMHYTQVSLKGIGKQQIQNPARTNPGATKNSQREIVETRVSYANREDFTYSAGFSVWSVEDGNHDRCYPRLQA
ncbi:hypothetical protein Vadar_011121 [Vaccinium darrowii]|uniref:Uncharacterized protein n=1 Tax=Vaccinium darrowii TaxID=229202 RepID=A0ACB7YKK4_9ERIC|nr:hypothetical protein Vadar_011121 [Vaccinium darrowii]